LKKEVKLTELSPGEKGIIDHLTLRGLERRRLMDLGFVKGSVVEVIRRSMFGDPTAYFIKGSVIALRREEADEILVIKIDEED